MNWTITNRWNDNPQTENPLSMKIWSASIGLFEMSKYDMKSNVIRFDVLENSYSKDRAGMVRPP